jgi:UDP-glucose:glycoprotein glucosyltransferase
VSLHNLLSSLAKRNSIRYIFRWRPLPGLPKNAKLILSGYGASLDIKKADYLAIDDRIIQVDVASESKSSVTFFEPTQDNIIFFGEQEEASLDLIPVKASDIEGGRTLSSLEFAYITEVSGLQELGIRATQFIMTSSSPLATLVRLSHDFPKHAHHLATKTPPINRELEAELHRIQSSKVPPGASVFWINGRRVPTQDLEPFTSVLAFMPLHASLRSLGYSLLEILRKERHWVQSLLKLDLTPSQAVEVLAHPAFGQAQSSASTPPRRGLMDIRTLGIIFDASDRQEEGDLIIWWNDLEKDQQYQAWSHSVHDVLYFRDHSPFHKAHRIAAHSYCAEHTPVQFLPWD